MNRIIRTAIAMLLALSVLAIVDEGVAAEKVAKPIRFDVLQSFQTDLPGVEKAQLIQFEMDPGAEVKKFKVVSEILWVTSGVFTYRYGKKVVERKAGERWFHKAGTVLDVSNQGDGVATLRGIQFIRTK